jgi:TolB protein
MKGMKRFVGVVAVAGLGLTGCPPLDEGGGGTGGGDFATGFVFVRADRNVYAVDDRGDPNSPIALTTGGRAQHPAVARNGGSVVFVRKTNTGAELQTVPTKLDATGQPQAASALFSTTDPACVGCTGLRSPVFSPDGQRIVFVIERGTGSPTSLGKVNADGSGFQELTPDTTIAYGAPSFFPNGQEVLAPAGSGLNSLNQLARVKLDGSSPQFISSLGGGVRVVLNRAVVSPDGTKVAFDGEVTVSGVTTSRIFVATVTPSYGTPVAVTDHPGETSARDSFPSWMGPNQIGFLSSAGGADNIYRVSVNTAAPASGTLLVPSAGEPAYGPI